MPFVRLNFRLSEAISEDPNYTLFQLDARQSSHSRFDCGAFAIEDSIRLFLNPEVPYLPDSQEDHFGDLPVSNVKHAPGSHLLSYSQRFRTHNLRPVLKESPYVWLAEGGQHQSCLVGTYNCLYKLQVIRKVCSDGLAQQKKVCMKLK